MAITVQQSPTYFNIANNHLVYVVTSDQTSQPQYQFVLDIKDKDGNLVQRLKQQPNPSNKGVFDIGHLISQQFDGHIEYLKPDDTLQHPDLAAFPVGQSYRTNGELPYSLFYSAISLNGGAAKQFNVFIGEEYGTSTTSVVTLYNGAGGVGNPSVSPTTEWQIYSQGVLDVNTRYPLWNAGWNLTNDYDTWYENQTIISGSTPLNLSVIKGNEAKWAPQRFYGCTYFYNTNYNVPSVTNPPMPLYGLHVGLTDFPITRSVQWDDYMTLSVFQGTDVDPTKVDEVVPQSSSLFIPNFQWINGGELIFYKADGSSTSRDLPGDSVLRSRVWDNTYPTLVNAADAYDPMYYWVSQSVEDTLLHFGIGPMNYNMSNTLGNQNSPFFDPVNHPDTYVTHYDVVLYGTMLGNASSYGDMRYAGRDRSGYFPSEEGSYGYTLPLAVLADAGFPTGSYSVPSAEFVIRGGFGGECIARIDYADIIYAPEFDVPCASVLAIQDCINRDMIASGSTARAFLTEVPADELALIESTFKENHDEKYWKYKLVIMDHSPDSEGGTLIMVLNPEANPSGDFFSTPLVGSSSCLGLATGLFGSNGGSSNTFGSATTPTIYFNGEENGAYYSTFETRRYVVDWSGYPGHYENCGYEKKQFYWVNKYGVYDYFTFTLAETITDDIERKDYKQTFVDFSSNSNTIDFNKSRRGKKQYQNKPTQRYRVESNWLTKEEADAVREMFFSTNVYYLEKQITQDIDYNFFNSINAGDDKNLKSPQNMGVSGVSTFDQIQEIPVVITNASITEKTNPRTDKLYRYTVEYQLANDLNPRV